MLFGGGDTNLYAYASNDPVNRSDTDGLDDDPNSGGICPVRPDLHLEKPLFLDQSKLPPTPPRWQDVQKQLEAAQKQAKEKDKGTKSSSGGGPNTIGPVQFSGSLSTPSLTDLREKDPKNWITGDFELKFPLNPDFTVPSKPDEPGSPDPAAPSTRHPPNSCAPNLEPGPERPNKCGE